MFSPVGSLTECLTKDDGTYKKLISTLCEACSYDLNSRGLKLLEEAASSISVAIDKLNELEQFIADNKSEGSRAVKRGETLNDFEPSASITKSLESNTSLEHQTKNNFTIYFSLNENVAETHVIEAFDKAGITNFVLDKLVNRINFAYGFISFQDENVFQNVTSSRHKISLGNSTMRIIPKTAISHLEKQQGNKVSKNMKRKIRAKKHMLNNSVVGKK